MRDRAARLSRAVGLAVAVGGGAGGACAAPSDRPVASLGVSTESGVAFIPLRESLLKPGRRTPTEQQALYERFLAEYPKDPLATVARLYLAFHYMEDPHDWPRADIELQRVGVPAPGTTRDLQVTARARWLRLHGQSEEGFLLLQPTIGKNVDPVARMLFHQELVMTTLARHLNLEVITYLDAWMRETTEDDREVVRTQVIVVLATMDRSVLEAAFVGTRRDRAALGYSKEIVGLLGQRLAALAVQEGDPKLARMLLEPEGAASMAGGPIGAALLALSESRRGIEVVEGRTVGLVIDRTFPREAAADVQRGVSWALGLPRRARDGLPKPPDAPEPLPWCAPRPAGAVPYDAPSASDRIRLVTRQADSSIELALEELAGEGASVLLVATRDSAASVVAAWSEKRKVATLLLGAPRGVVQSSHAFVLGAAEDEGGAALEAAGVSDAVAVADDVAIPVSLAPRTAVACTAADGVGSIAGAPRFPLAVWAREHTRAWVVLGGAGCVSTLLGELGEREGVVGILLGAASFPKHGSRLRVKTAAAGLVPLRGDKHGGELGRYVGAFGPHLDWWAAVGRDAAVLARKALLTLPTDATNEAGAMAERKRLAREALGRARGALWSTERYGFDGEERRLSRTVCVVEVPPGR
ncbi:MAG: hypothetical protein WCI05_03395 [Myxococcales bacterium]